MPRRTRVRSLILLGASIACVVGLSAQGPEVRIFTPTEGQIVVPEARVVTRGGEVATERVQQIPVGSGQISGTVVRADTGRPIREANVTLTGPSDVPLMRGRGAGAANGRSEGAGGLRGLQPTVGATQGVPGSSATAVAGMPVTRTARTDDQGAFVFDHLPSGRFSIAVSRPQFLQANYGQRAPGRSGKVVDFKDGQRLSLTIPMVRTSVITGLVLGEDGEPLAQANVRVMQSVMSGGVRALQQTNGTSSDDRGVYRVSGLRPGDYVVYATPGPGDFMQADRVAAERAAFDAAYRSASAGGGRPPTVVAVSVPGPPTGITSMPGFAPTYFPGTPIIAAASTITLGPGEERGNVDFRVQNVRAADVRGRVNIGAGFPAALRIMMAYRDRSTLGPPPPGGAVNPDGTFIIRGVPPGEYIVMVQTMAQPQRGVQIINGQTAMREMPQAQDYPRMWAQAVVTVDGQSAPEVFLELQPGRSISGQVEFDMANPPNLATSRLMVNATIAAANNPQLFPAGPLPSAQIQPDGRFVLEGVTPGMYTLRASGGLVKSAIINGVDTLDFPFEFTGERDIAGAVLTLTDKGSELSGQLTEVTGEPGYDYTVLAVADDSRYWLPNSRRIVTARPGTGGQFVFRNLPPGGYYLAAVTDLEPGSQYDPAFLKELAGAAMRVTVVENGRHVQNIRVAR